MFRTISELLKKMRGDKYLNELMGSTEKAEITYRIHPKEPAFDQTRLFSHHPYHIAVTSDSLTYGPGHRYAIH